ncbi:MAG: phosphate ABC transporter permease subunit PstC [Nitrospirae bacterium]|nr:phosphate ABC transporter permease subunit PstC [Nitrospirota bacterium]MBI5694638.1 phosphate ABC transporter permease subunit PstC [Nitrospirota bacterium]
MAGSIKRSGKFDIERAFRGGTAALALSVLVLGAIIVYELFSSSGPAFDRFGFGFITSRDWDPVSELYGALPFIWGTFYTSILALVIALPLSLGIAVFLTELAPVWLRGPIGFMVELLAAIPSLVYGLWGLFVLAPIMQEHIQPFLAQYDYLPFFKGYPLGLGIMTASVIVAIMILPTISSISREVMYTVPETQREGGLALGMTRWEVVSKVVIPYSRSGILGGVILGFGRALGETMAVTMVIGNTPQITMSLFDPGYTIASVLANEFAEATEKVHLSVLVELGLILFVISILMNSAAKLLLWRMNRYGSGSGS